MGRYPLAISTLDTLYLLLIKLKNWLSNFRGMGYNSFQKFAASDYFFCDCHLSKKGGGKVNPKEFYFAIVNNASFYFILVIIAFLLLYLAFYKKSRPSRRKNL